MMPRELARELGLNPVQFDVSKYNENQPRVPAGNGRASGQWNQLALHQGWSKEDPPGRIPTTSII